MTISRIVLLEDLAAKEEYIRLADKELSVKCMESEWAAMKYLPYMMQERIFLTVYQKKDDEAHVLTMKPLMQVSDMNASEINFYHWNLYVQERNTKNMPLGPFDDRRLIKRLLDEVEQPQISRNLIHLLKELGVKDDKLVLTVPRDSIDAKTSSYVSDTYTFDVPSIVESLHQKGFGYFLAHNHPYVSAVDLDSQREEMLREQLQISKNDPKAFEKMNAYLASERFSISQEDIYQTGIFSTDKIGLIGAAADPELNRDDEDAFRNMPMKSEDYIGFSVYSGDCEEITIGFDNMKNHPDLEKRKQELRSIEGLNKLMFLYHKQ